MKKLTLAILLILSSSSFATGIPVIDVAGIAQMIKEATIQAEQFKQQYDNMKNQLDTAKATADHYKKMVEGHWNIAQLLNDPAIMNALPVNWKDIYSSASNLSSLREQYNLKSNNPVIQKQYDNELIGLSLAESLYKSSYSIAGKIQKLQQEFSQAATPSTKQDLSNAINYEVAKLQSQQMIIDKMDQLQQKEKQLQQQKSANDLRNKMWGKYKE